MILLKGKFGSLNLPTALELFLLLSLIFPETRTLLFHKKHLGM